ncbi:hypothetical protein LTR36_006118 [Oleoguttula mirabilis]|uniref:ER lumen protein retaining receptor n=1 Tax=Oleoguttula mirabilis TaxID=1507867 RepID=A0AAV9JCH6_9PEZI|nr:hypothetical protein LTR36_006118 [Oleoguttula mirabilis]
MFNMNIFRILGDLSHTASKCILIYSIHHNSSAEGVSLLTQLLYILVFGTRYLDLFWVPPWWSWWNFVLKIFYMASSAYIVYVMMRVYARTREKEYGWKLATWSLGGSVLSAPVVCLLFRGWGATTLSEVLWTFSIILESVCILPQLLLLRQTSVPTVIDSFYLVTLGSYRFFYLLNWIVRGIGEGHFDPISVLFGIVQTALYIDFAWVYWSRQRVKLRGGGVVDSDDLSKSFIVRRFIGRKGNSEDDEDIVDEDTAALAEQENGTSNGNGRPSVPRSGRSWGARGISVSADETLAAADRPGAQSKHGESYADNVAAEDAPQMADPSHFEDDGDDEEDVDAPLPPAKDAGYHPRSNPTSPTDSHARAAELMGSSAGEWQENTGAAK